MYRIFKLKVTDSSAECQTSVNSFYFHFMSSLGNSITFNLVIWFMIMTERFNFICLEYSSAIAGISTPNILIIKKHNDRSAPFLIAIFLFAYIIINIKKCLLKSFFKVILFKLRLFHEYPFEIFLAILAYCFSSMPIKHTKQHSLFSSRQIYFCGYVSIFLFHSPSLH